jgi:hypothetical protein
LARTEVLEAIPETGEFLNRDRSRASAGNKATTTIVSAETSSYHRLLGRSPGAVVSMGY